MPPGERGVGKAKERRSSRGLHTISVRSQRDGRGGLAMPVRVLSVKSCQLATIHAKIGLRVRAFSLVIVGVSRHG